MTFKRNTNSSSIWMPYGWHLGRSVRLSASLSVCLSVCPLVRPPVCKPLRQSVDHAEQSAHRFKYEYLSVTRLSAQVATSTSTSTSTFNFASMRIYLSCLFIPFSGVSALYIFMICRLDCLRPPSAKSVSVPYVVARSPVACCMLLVACCRLLVARTSLVPFVCCRSN